MAQRVTTSFINTNRPGSYFDVQVKSTPVGVASSGNIVIIGEASGGAAVKGIDTTSGDLLKDNFYTPDQLAAVTKKYGSGPIVDAFRAIASPSADANITGSANRIYIAKTNKGAQAQATVATAYGTLKDKNWGVDGNKYAYTITQSAAEVAPSKNGTVIGVFGAALDATSFKIRVNGGAEVTITLSGTPANHADIGTLVTELDALLTASGMSAVAGSPANSLIIQMDADAAANAKGYGKSFELIDSTPGDLASIGHVAGINTSSQEPEIQVDITRQDNNTNESYVVKADVALEIGYLGTTATLTITDTALTTTVVGGTGTSLSLQLVDYTTVADLASYINAQTGYSCSVVAASTQTSPVKLDNVSAMTIASTGVGLKAGRVKKAAANFKAALDQSAVLNFTATAALGLPIVADKTYLAGGLVGFTTAANVVTAVTDLEGIDVNFVLPLFSQDASVDIAAGLTDSQSTYTIDAVNALVKSHVLKMSTAKIKKHRSCVLSFWGTYAEAKTKAGTLANARCSMVMQKSTQINSQGVQTKFLPWYTAAIAAGMQVAGFYKSITNKLANVISYEDPSGFDSGSPGNIEEALDAGIMFMEKAVVGNKWVSDQTTYGIDTNFVYNSMQAMYSADLVALDLSASFQTAFVGQSLADVDAATAIAFLASKMDQYKKQKLIAASDDAPLGFKNAKVSISGPIMAVSVEIKLSTAILFIPISIEISQVTSAA